MCLVWWCSGTDHGITHTSSPTPGTEHTSSCTPNLLQVCVCRCVCAETQWCRLTKHTHSTAQPSCTHCFHMERAPLMIIIHHTTCMRSSSTAPFSYPHAGTLRTGRPPRHHQAHSHALALAESQRPNSSPLSTAHPHPRSQSRKSLDDSHSVRLSPTRRSSPSRRKARSV
jgi:hypothetical protein